MQEESRPEREGKSRVVRVGEPGSGGLFVGAFQSCKMTDSEVGE